MLIESHDRYDDVGEFDQASGELTQFSRSSPGEHRELLNQPLRGHYAWLGGKLSVLFRHSGSLWLSVGGPALNLDSPDIEIRRSQVGVRCRLAVLAHGVELEGIEYSLDLESASTEDITPFVEREDQDFGLFVENVFKDSARRGRIYK